MTPNHQNIWDSIRRFCSDCVGEGCRSITCDTADCHVWAIRRKRGQHTKSQALSVIRCECVDCLGSPADICTSPKCALHSYRLGIDRNASAKADQQRRSKRGSSIPAIL